VTEAVLPGGDGLMGDQHMSTPRTAPVRIVGMRIAPEPVARADGLLTIVAQLDPGPDRSEWSWWMEQLRARVNVEAWTLPTGMGSSSEMTAVHIWAHEDQLEEAAKQLLTAIEELNAARREREARVTGEQRRQQQSLADLQAILDRVINEYRENETD
jgi:hypothetical protein